MPPRQGARTPSPLTVTTLALASSYLLPHLLPSKPGLDTHSLSHPATNTIQRLFKMSFVPVGFWQRFIARMLISLAEMDLQVAADGGGGVGVRGEETQGGPSEIQSGGREIAWR